MRKKISSEKIAELANVSQSTVSRAFDPKSSVSAKTRKKVLDVANEFNYKPNALARGLITNKSKLIGIAMKEKQNPFYYEVLSLFTQKLKEYGFSVLFVYTENEQIQQEEIAKFWEYNVEAIIITDAFLSSEMVKKLKNANIPVILFNREDEDLQCNSVSSDNIYASQSIAQYFYDKKFKKILYVSGKKNTSTNRDRFYGFNSFFEQKNQKIDVIESDFTFESAYQLTLEYLKDGNHPNAIFGANDITALGVLEAVKEMKLNIPDDVEIVGFDDIKMASWPNNQLTTWSQPLEIMVNETIKILLEGNLLTNRRIKIKGDFKFRKTTSNK
ncbi:LacI family transcriptional regulator [Staphylococcus succinus]|uniref:LacI family DNA-binding transcriptional regulator n=1 Tax=Staphylococcus succinus TaxID=61015 RepID=UPI000C3266EE|nr:LacI family DNA-binding transcriptional regulator [Staphylococcus succinus]PKI21266.1 LacI family transcriptional regulator [Staphylococcus succinus]PTI49094.1 LacI family transcriptional regulator [Staphylococcus succinus]